MTLPMPASPACARAAVGAVSNPASAATTTASAALVRGMRGLPSTRLLPGGVVEVHDHLPDLLLAQAVFPGGHDGVPRRRFLRQAGPPLRDPPEQERLLEHRDRARILEVRGRRIEAVREVSLPVEVVAVAVHAVADVDLAARRDVL